MVTVYFLVYLAVGGYGTAGSAAEKTLYRFDTKEACEEVRIAGKSKDLVCIEIDRIDSHAGMPYHSKNWF